MVIPKIFNLSSKTFSRYQINIFLRNLHPQLSTIILNLKLRYKITSADCHLLSFFYNGDKGFSVIVRDRSDYLHEASRQIQDHNIDVNVKFNDNILTNLVAKTNKTFERLCSHKLISEKELKYFTYNFKKATNLRKLYFLPKIHKRCPG